MSRFGSAEPYIVGLLVPSVASGVLGEAIAVVANGLLAQPGAYPSIFVCSYAPNKISESEGGSHSQVEFTQRTDVIIRVQSDGIKIGEAKQTAWALFDTVADLIHNQVADGAPAGTTFGPLIPGTPLEIENVLPGEFGILLPIDCIIYWCK